MSLAPFLAIATLLTALLLAFRRPASAGTAISATDSRGMAWRRRCLERGGVAATVDEDGRPIVLAWPMDHRGCGSILVIDAQSGRDGSDSDPVRDGLHAFRRAAVHEEPGSIHTSTNSWSSMRTPVVSLSGRMRRRTSRCRLRKTITAWSGPARIPTANC